MFERCARECEEAVESAVCQPLSLAQAALVSGYSGEHLAREVREGRIPNAGRKHAPRIRRGDLPRKPGALTSVPLATSIAGARRRIARAIVNPEQGVHDDAA